MHADEVKLDTQAQNTRKFVPNAHMDAGSEADAYWNTDADIDANTDDQKAVVKTKSGKSFNTKGGDGNGTAVVSSGKRFTVKRPAMGKDTMSVT
jgi:hypothetical protein